MDLDELRIQHQRLVNKLKRIQHTEVRTVEETDQFVFSLMFHKGSINRELMDKYFPRERCNESSICGICLCDMQGSLMRRLSCKHCFHGACIDRWFVKYRKYTCPTCRTHFLE